MGGYLPVRNKQEFVLRYGNNEFGNCAPTWVSLSDFLQSDYRGLMHIRNRVAGGPTWYNLSPEDLCRRWGMLIDGGIDPNTLYISAMCPTEKTILQGEVVQSVNHLDLTYSTVVAPMRDALKQSTKFATGIVAVSLLQWAMDGKSYDWLQHLLDNYPGHVVEFTCLSVCWGTVLNCNTLFWEVRLY